MSTITTRAGKGSPLTNNEVDANFTNLNNDKLESADLSGYAELTGATFTGDVEGTEFIGSLRGNNIFKAKAGEALSKGDAVYISGISGNTPVVSLADADSAGKMPAFGLASDAASANSAVDIVTYGQLTSVDTSAFSLGDTLYVSNTPGQLVSTAPSGESSLVQNLGKVERVHATAGILFVAGAGRTNATPNLNDGQFFLGNGSNQAVSADFTTSVLGEISAGTGIGISASGVISNTDPDQTVSLTGAGATSISGTYPNFTISSTDSNTTYTAGTGITLSGTTFSLTDTNAKLNLTGGTLTGALSGNSFSDGYVTWTAAQFNRYGAAIELQYTPTNSATLVKIGANGSNPTIFNAYTGQAAFTGALSGTTATFSGSVTAPSIRASSGAFHVNRSNDGASAIRVDADGVVVIPNNYFYVSASQGSYFSSTVRFRGTIHNDTGTDVTIGDTLNVTEGIKLNGTTVIDSSRNLNVSTGASSGRFAVMSSSTHGTYDFYNNGTTYLNGSTIIDEALSLTGANAKLQISGTTVIDPSRNLTNVHTISSTAFSSTNNGTNRFNVNIGGTGETWSANSRASLHLDGSSSAIIGFRHSGGNRGYIYSAGSTLEVLSYGDVHLLSNASASYFGKLSSGVWNTSHGYQVNGTTVIDSSRTHFSGIKGYATTATGSTSITASTGIKQTYAEGWTAIYADYDPYHEWGIYHDNPNNYFLITAGTATNNIGSFSVVNHAGNTRTAYAKIRLDQNTGEIRAGGGYYVSNTQVLDTSRNLTNIGNITTGADSYITFGPNSTWANSLRVGGNGRAATGTAMASVATTNGNLHLDAASNRGIYLNHYAGTAGTLFGNGASATVARMDSGGQLYKSGGTTNPYWNAANDGSGSGLDADTLDGVQLANIARTDGHETFTSNLTVNGVLYLGDNNDGYFYSDQNGRTAFANGDFYIQSSVTNYYNYATNQYIGDSSGDNIYFRGNVLSGTGWGINGAGMLTTRDHLLNAGYHLQRSDHHSGHLEGSYNNVGANGTKSNPIYTIGSSYNPADSTLGNMYGIGFTSVGASFINGAMNTGNWGMYVAADGDARVWLEATQGRVVAASDIRAPQFYDSNDTNYYVDPASGSRLGGLHQPDRLSLRHNGNFGTPRWDFRAYVVESPHFYGHSASGDIYWGEAGNANQMRGSLYAPILYDYNNTGFYFDGSSTGTSVRISGDVLIDQQYGKGVVGVYASTVLQHVWSMGAAYRVSADGASAGNMYGLAWSHPNAGSLGGANNLNDHGLLLLNNGSFRAAISSRAVFSADVRGTLFYDYNDTGYYVDPHNNSSLRTLTVNGTANNVYSTPNILSIGAPASAGVALYHLRFNRSDGTANGHISTNYYQTTYATTSDYRVKEDFQPIINATSRLMSLNPVNFQWKDSDIRTDGFLAHEVAEVVSDAVVGEKDAVDEQGNDELQALDQSKLVPLLVKTIQELEARITALENA